MPQEQITQPVQLHPLLSKREVIFSRTICNLIGQNYSIPSHEMQAACDLAGAITEDMLKRYGGETTEGLYEPVMFEYGRAKIDSWRQLDPKDLPII